MLIKSAVRRRGLATRILRSAAGLWFPDFSLVVPKRNNVLAVRRRPEGAGVRIDVIPACNIVTNDGDQYYAQQAVAESNPNDFGVQIMATYGTPDKAAVYEDFTTIAASEQPHDSGYPMTNDLDADNTGAGVDVITWTASWAAADFDTDSLPPISSGIITNTSPGSGELLLTGYDFASEFEKAATDTLKVIVNHTMTGV